VRKSPAEITAGDHPVTRVIPVAGGFGDRVIVVIVTAVHSSAAQCHASTGRGDAPDCREEIEITRCQSSSDIGGKITADEFSGHLGGCCFAYTSGKSVKPGSGEIRKLLERTLNSQTASRLEGSLNSPRVTLKFLSTSCRARNLAENSKVRDSDHPEAQSARLGAFRSLRTDWRDRRILR